MGFRFFRRMNIAPGVRLNFSKSGISTSLGVRGARITLGKTGVRKTVGIPGTGLFYTEVSDGSWEEREIKKSGGTGAPRGAGGGRKKHRKRRKSSPTPMPQHQLDLGFFERMLTPKIERAFVDGCKEYVAGREAAALNQFRESAHLADGSFLGGFLSLRAKRFEEAENYLKQAVSMHRTLGKYFAKYHFQAELSLQITPEIEAHIMPCRRGALLGLVEALQHQGKMREALDCLKRLRKDMPDDVVVNLSMAELISEAAGTNKKLAKQIVELASNVKNDSSVHASLMLYQARALRTLGLNTAARNVLTTALRKKKGRNDDLLHALRYERACVYAVLGKKTQSRREFEILYAQSPSYEDVAQRLDI